jgi:hypothetical protein
MDTLLASLSVLVLVVAYKLLHRELDPPHSKAKPRKRKRQ